jgi:hypothetical protein
METLGPLLNYVASMPHDEAKQLGTWQLGNLVSWPLGTWYLGTWQNQIYKYCSIHILSIIKLFVVDNSTIALSDPAEAR